MPHREQGSGMTKGRHLLLASREDMKNEKSFEIASGS